MFPTKAKEEVEDIDEALTRFNELVKSLDWEGKGLTLKECTDTSNAAQKERSALTTPVNGLEKRHKTGCNNALVAKHHAVAH